MSGEEFDLEGLKLTVKPYSPVKYRVGLAKFIAYG